MNEDAVRIWVRRAENDLKTGTDELATAEPATDTICFHMQQCCEKYLKAFLVSRGQEYPRTHDVALLVELCRRLDGEFQTLADCGAHTLTKYAVGVRYDEEVFPPLEETKAAVELAEKVRDFVRGKLRQGHAEP